MATAFLTDAGLAKLAVATPLQPVKVKYLVADIEDGTPTQSMTSVFSEGHRAEITDPVRTPEDPSILLFNGTIPESVGGWTIYGLGLLGEAGELLAYWKLEAPIPKPPADSPIKMAISPDMYIKLSNADQTQLIVTASTLFRHNSTTERDAADAHPMSSITGLDVALNQQSENIGIDRKYKKVTSNYTVLNNDGGFLDIDASAGNMTITMPKSTAFIAKKITFVRTDTTTNVVSIVAAAGDVYCGEGVAWPQMAIRERATITFTFGENIVAGIRGSVVQIYRSNGNSELWDAGVKQGNILLEDGDASNLSAATTAKKGVIQLATAAEVKAGTNAEKAITPATLKSSLGADGDAPIFGARAWCNFNADNGTIRAQGNIASVTRVAMGVYDVVFTVPMTDANYCVISTPSKRGSEAVSLTMETSNQTASGFKIFATFGGDNTIGTYDPQSCSLTVFR